MVVLTPEYERVRHYEGIYEDEGGGTLQIIASPRDNVLVAVLDGAKYPLKTVGADLFTNNTGQRVKFSLETGHEGYRLLDSAEPGFLTSYSLRFTTPGTYLYVCTLHPGMAGAIQVTP